MYGLTIRSIFFFLHHQTRAGLRLDCVPAVVRFYLRRSGSLRAGVRSSSPRATGIDETELTPMKRGLRVDEQITIRAGHL